MSTLNRTSPHQITTAGTEIAPADVHATLSRTMLADGFEFVIDLEKSRGSYIYDSRTGRKFLDFFTFFASGSVGMNHPALTAPAMMAKFARVAVNKPSNSDAYTVEMAEFVDTFERLAMPPSMKHVFFVDGGALAVENALKAAFDWKVRKNLAKGYQTETGHKVIHFKRAFHGRSGYTLSLTNTDPVKTMYFPKFDWPRIHNPALKFPLTEETIAQVIKEEQIALGQIKAAITDHKDDIAALIIEPIQCEGGDNHFRKEFLVALRRVCDENGIMLIFDEVQCGVGITGRMWAHEWFVEPDMMVFGKKTQICGFMANERIDEVPENVFRKPSRINSTFGGNLVDMVRFKAILDIIHEEKMIRNAEVVGAHLLKGLNELYAEFPELVSNPRGRGLLCSFDLPKTEQRDKFRKEAYARGLMILACGEKSLRFRPPLNLSEAEADDGLSIIRDTLKAMK